MNQIQLGYHIFDSTILYAELRNFSNFNFPFWPPGSFNYDGMCDSYEKFVLNRLTASWEMK